MSQFIINGGKKLEGEITVNTAKNSAVALIFASLLNEGRTTIKNTPQIEEVKRLIEVIESIGVSTRWVDHDLIIEPPAEYNMEHLDIEAGQKTRSIILAMGALAGRLREFSIPKAGGCRLGSRTIMPHIYGLENFGIKISETNDNFVIKNTKLKPSEFVLYETGDTVTENILLAASQIEETSTIRMASANYMVQDLCCFLEKLGVKIKGKGSSTLEITGKKNIKKNITYEISPDPIEAMFFISLAVSTNSNLLIKNCPLEFLELELLKLEKMGLEYKIKKQYLAGNNYTRLADIEILPSRLIAPEDKLHAMPFPGINQDNLPFFVPIVTTAKGSTLIHDWTYETRAIYFSELNRLGANITLMDPHRVTVEGPTKLKGTEIVCPPALRPSAIILVAMIAAQGKSILRNIYPIHRGYENLEDRLRSIGVDIELIKE